MLKFLILFSLVSLINCQSWNESTYFANTADLSKDVSLNWNFTSEDIYFKLVAKTNGWMGFGLSPNGGMLNSDLMVTWADPDGTIQFKDAHSDPTEFKIYPDTVANWKLLFYNRANGVTTVIFTRKITICPAPGQPFIETNINVEPQAYVIFAYGNNFKSNFPTYHGNTRGSKSLPLLVPNGKVNFDMTQVEEVEFIVNVKSKPFNF